MTNVQDLYSEGFLYHQQGNLDDAEVLYKKALELDPDNLNCVFMMANLKYQQYRFIEAERFIKHAIQLSKNIRFYDLLSRIKIEKKEYKEAIEAAIQGLRMDADNFELNFNLALAFKNHGDYEHSLQFYKRAEKLNPDLYLVPYNMSSAYFFLGHPDKATNELKKALTLCPNNDELKYFLALSMFRERNYSEGLELFESRLYKKTATLSQAKMYPVSFATAREWKGEDISNKRLFLYYEAGFGDVIQYARYFPLIRELCSKLLFKPQEDLVELFNENPLGIDTIVTYKDDNPEFDVYAPILSLPLLLGMDEQSMFVGKEGYIKANPKKKEAFRQRFFNNDKIKIGIKWQGNTASETDRVINIEAFEPLFKLPNTQFYSFQTGSGSEELEKIASKYSIIDVSKEFENFSDTAAALDNLDYVICNDTSLLHLAGALGKTSFMLLPMDYNWRWHLDFDNNDWYSSVRAFKQVKNGDWSEPMQRVFNELKSLVSKNL